MENIRVFEEGGYIHFILRPEELMRLRYSEQSTIAFSAFMDGWLGQMKTQVRENTMDGYRYAFEKHIRPFFDARGMTLATARPMDFQDFVNFKFEQGLSPTSIAKFHSIMHKCLKYAVALQIIPNNPSDNVMLPKRRRFRGQVYDRAQLNVFLAAALQSPAEAALVLAASYGLRRSECAGLRWSAIDFRARRMVINHTAILSNGRILYVDNVKTRSSYRTLPLSDSLRRYLTDLRRRQKENRRKYGKSYHQSDYVCVREDGTPGLYFPRVRARLPPRRSAVHPVSRSAAFGRDAPAPAGLFPQADSGMARSFGYRHDRKRLRARAVCGEGVYRQERDSDHRNLRDARLFQLFGVRDFSEKFGKGNAFFEIAGLTVKLIILPAISKRFSHWYWRSLARSLCLPVRRSRIRPTSRSRMKSWTLSLSWA